MMQKRFSTMLMGLLVFSCRPCEAQMRVTPSATPQQQSAQIQRVRVSGMVVNSVTGEPVPRALVTIYGMEPRTALTDTEGNFSFEGVPDGYFNWVVQKPGYMPSNEGSGRGMVQTRYMPSNGGPARGVVQAQSNMDSLVVKLTPQAVISGRVLDAQEEPLERVPVRVTRARIVDGRKRWYQAGQAQTGIDGQFRIANLEPGVYYVSAGPAPDRTSILERKGYASTYYPGVTDPSGAALLRLSAGQQLQADFSLSAVPLYRMRGSILGLPPGNNSLFLSPQLSDATATHVDLPTRVDSQTGAFELLAVPPGRYTLMALSADSTGRQLRARTSVVVTDNIDGVQLTLQSGITIPLDIRKEVTQTSQQSQGIGGGVIGRVSGGVVGGVVGGFRPGSELGVNVHLRALGDDSQEVYASQEGPEPQSKLSLRNVLPGKYAVQLDSYGSWYVESARCGSANLLQEPLIVTAGGQIDPIEVVLRDDGGSLRGTVRSSLPNTLGFVLALPDHGGGSLPLVGRFDGQGNMMFPKLRPGDYSVLAFKDLESVEYMNPEAIKPYQSKAAHVSVVANQTAEIAIDLTGVEE